MLRAVHNGLWVPARSLETSAPSGRPPCGCDPTGASVQTNRTIAPSAITDSHAVDSRPGAHSDAAPHSTLDHLNGSKQLHLCLTQPGATITTGSMRVGAAFVTGLYMVMVPLAGPLFRHATQKAGRETLKDCPISHVPERHSWVGRAGLEPATQGL